jgi:hypothetical protein
MKTLIFAFVGASLLTSPLLPAQGTGAADNSPKCSVAISAKKSEVTLGKAIVLTIKTTNISDETIELSFGHRGDMPDAFQFEILDENGQPVKKNGHRFVTLPNGEVVEAPATLAGSRRIGAMAPGETWELQAIITEEYDFDHPGSYSIRACLPARNATSTHAAFPRVCSDPATITVLATKQ